MRYTSQGKGNVKFLKLLFLQSATADAIASSIVGFLRSVNIELCRLVMLTSDGANVMLGSHNGVHVKLCAHQGRRNRSGRSGFGRTFIWLRLDLIYAHVRKHVGSSS